MHFQYYPQLMACQLKEMKNPWRYEVFPGTTGSFLFLFAHVFWLVQSTASLKTSYLILWIILIIYKDRDLVYLV